MLSTRCATWKDVCGPHPERGYPLLSNAWRFRPHGEILNSVVLPCARPYRGQEMGGAFTIGA